MSILLELELQVQIQRYDGTTTTSVVSVVSPTFLRSNSCSTSLRFVQKVLCVCTPFISPSSDNTISSILQRRSKILIINPIVR